MVVMRTKACLVFKKKKVSMRTDASLFCRHKHKSIMPEIAEVNCAGMERLDEGSE